MAKKEVTSKMMRHEAPFVIFDLETGGLSKDKHALCEIGAVAMDWHLNELNDKTFLKLIKPYAEESEYEKVYTAKAMQVNKLTVEDLESQGEDLEKVIKDFSKYLKGFTKLPSKKKPTLVGHNIRKFDIPFISHYFDMFKLDFESHFDAYIDTLDLSRQVLTEVPNFQLGTICGLFGIENENAHSALGDVEVNAKLLKVLMKSIRGEGLALKKEEDNFRAKFQF